MVLGCTEIPLIMNDDNSPLPTLDSTRLLARAALRRAVGALRRRGQLTDHSSGRSVRLIDHSSGAMQGPDTRTRLVLHGDAAVL